jgi:starch synthase (maltosyl-transferring)
VRRWPPADDDLSPMIEVINRIRRENIALQQNATLTFHETTNEQMICYSKTAGQNAIVCVVNLDPHNTQSTEVDLHYAALQLEPGKPFQVHDLLSGARFTWHSGKNTLTLNPHVVPAHIFRIRRRVRTERDFEYFL